MEMRLHGVQWAARLGRDLSQGPLGEEAERDGLAIRLVEPGNRGADPGGVLGPKGEDRRIRGSALAQPGGPGLVRSGRVDPRDGPPTGGLPKRDPDGDPAEPRAERALSPPRAERSEGGHERLLRDVLSLVPVAEDPMTSADHERGFALDEAAKGFAIAGQDGRDHRAFIERLGDGF